MTTILISILSGILGLTVGFTIGRYGSANCASTFGEWSLQKWDGIYDSNKYYISGINKAKDYFVVELNKNGNIDIIAKKSKYHAAK